MSKRDKIRWGEWVIERSHACGFRNQRALAEAVGCRHEQVSRWAQMVLPPSQMRKGFDKTLASALQTSLKVLFRDFTSVAPESAPLLIISGDHLFKSADKNRAHHFPVEKMLADVIGQMDLGELERMFEFGLQVVLAKNDSRRPIIENIARNYGSVTMRPMTAEDEKRLALHKAKQKL